MEGPSGIGRPSWPLAALALIFVIGYARASTCDFSVPKAYFREDVVSCFETIPWDPQLADPLFDNVEKYLRMSTFTDDFMNPPSGFEYLKKDSEKIVRELKSNSHNYEYEYQAHMDLVDLYKSGHDRHQLYYPPKCFSSVMYSLPYTIRPIFENGKTKFIFAQFEEYITPYYDDITENVTEKGYTTCQEANSFEGLEVIAINDLEPIEFLRDFKQWQYRSKFEGSMFNAALLNEFTANVIMFNFPQYDGVTFTVIDKDGVKTDLRFPYMYFVIPEINSPEVFKDICFNGPNKDVLSDLSYSILNVVDPSIFGYESLYRLWAQWFKENNEQSKNVKKETDQLQILEEESSFSFVKRVCEMEDNYWIDIYKHENENVAVFRLKGLLPQNVMQVRRDVEKLAPYNVSRVLFDVRYNGGGLMSLTDYIPVWFNFDIFQPPNCLMRKRLDPYFMKMINSGYDDAMNEFLSNKPKQLSEIVSNPIPRQFIDSTVDPPTIFEYNYTDSFTEESGTFLNRDGTWSFGEYPGLEQDFYKPLFYFDRTQVMVLTDGICGSGCAILCWHFQEMMGGRIMTVGGLKTNDETILPGFGAYTGASMLSNDNIMDMMRKAGLTPGENDMPGELPHGAKLSVSWYEVYSFIDQEKPREFAEQHQDFHLWYYSKPMLEPNYDQEYPVLLDEVFKIWDDHTSYSDYEKQHDAQQTDIKCPPTDDHGVYGHLWNENDKNYTGECIFLYCEDTYYLNPYTNVCERIPFVDEEYPTDEDPEKATIIALSIVLAVVIIAYAITTILLVLKNRKSEPARQPLIEE